MFFASQVGSLFFGTRAAAISGEGLGGSDATTGSHPRTRVFVIPRRGVGGWGDEPGPGRRVGAEEREGRGQEGRGQEGAIERSGGDHLRESEGDGSGGRGRKDEGKEGDGSCVAAQLRKPVVMALEGFGTASGGCLQCVPSVCGRGALHYVSATRTDHTVTILYP